MKNILNSATVLRTIDTIGVRVKLSLDMFFVLKPTKNTCKKEPKYIITGLNILSIFFVFNHGAIIWSSAPSGIFTNTVVVVSAPIKFTITFYVVHVISPPSPNKVNMCKLFWKIDGAHLLQISQESTNFLKL